jgi:hypothetical protein
MLWWAKRWTVKKHCQRSAESRVLGLRVSRRWVLAQLYRPLHHPLKLQDRGQMQAEAIEAGVRRAVVVCVPGWASCRGICMYDWDV